MTQRRAIETSANFAQPFPYSVKVSTNAGGSWLSANRVTGITGESITVSVNPGSLTPGTYRGTVSVTILIPASVVLSGSTFRSRSRYRSWIPMRDTPLSRRHALGLAAVTAFARAPQMRIAMFQCDVTPPIGGPLFNGVAARSIVDPLFANGVVLLQSDKPAAVLIALDWCEIRNGAYDYWRSELGRAAGVAPERVLLSCVHQHDAPYVDTDAQGMLDDPRLCDPAFHQRTVARVSAALTQSLMKPRRITHIGTGQAKVERVASNRRYVTPAGKVSYGRTSATRDAYVRNQPEGLIDPWLKTISFWENDTPVAALNCYSTHPMTFYGKGDVSADFVGMARAQRQRETPDVAQIYFSGASGDTMAGRYNDGEPANRPALASRVHQGMVDAWNQTQRHPVRPIGFRNVPLRLAPRKTKGFSAAELRGVLNNHEAPYRERSEAALGLSWLARIDRPIDVPVIDLGPAQIILLPAESFVQYQLWAQQARPDSMVMTLGFGECAPGYIPTAQDAADGYDDHYSWIAFAECEAAIRAAVAKALTKSR